MILLKFNPISGGERTVLELWLFSGPCGNQKILLQHNIMYFSLNFKFYSKGPGTEMKIPVLGKGVLRRKGVPLRLFFLVP